MIELIKKLFYKESKPLPKELTLKEQRLLSLLERNKTYFDSIGKEFYLLDGRLIKHLGRWSYPDVDMTKSGAVGKVLETGEIIDISYDYLFYYKPHDWVKLLSNDDIINYSTESNKDLEYLYNKYYQRLPIEAKRELKLKEILND